MKAVNRCFIYLIAVFGLFAGHVAQAQSSSSSSSSSRPATLPPLQPGFVECARRGEICSFTGTRTMLTDSCFEYTCWTWKEVVTGSAICRGYLSGAFSRCAYSVDELTVAAPFPGLTASASTQSGAGKSAAKTIDGDADTRWEASNSTTGSWLRVSGTAAIYLSRIEVFEAGSKIRGYRIEYLQGNVWTPLVEGGAVGPHLVIDMAGRTPVLTTAVRIITTSVSSGQPSISEFVVLGNRPRPASSSSSSSSSGMCGPSTGSCCNGVPCDMTCLNPANWNLPMCKASSSSSSASGIGALSASKFSPAIATLTSLCSGAASNALASCSGMAAVDPTLHAAALGVRV